MQVHHLDSCKVLSPWRQDQSLHAQTANTSEYRDSVTLIADSEGALRPPRGFALGLLAAASLGASVAAAAPLPPAPPVAVALQGPAHDMFDGYRVLSHLARDSGATEIAGGALRDALARASSPFEKQTVAREALRQQDATLARQATMESREMLAANTVEPSSRDCVLLADVEGRLGQEAPVGWRWGQERPCGSPVVDAADAVVRTGDGPLRLPDGSLLHDQYGVYVLQRGADGATAWHDVARGTRAESAGLLKNGVDSGEVLQVIVPSAAGQRHLLVNRGSTFEEEGTFPAGTTYRALLQSQIRHAVRSRAARDRRFRARLETLGVDVRASSGEDLLRRLEDLAAAVRTNS